MPANLDTKGFGSNINSIVSDAMYIALNTSCTHMLLVVHDIDTTRNETMQRSLQNWFEEFFSLPTVPGMACGAFGTFCNARDRCYDGYTANFPNRQRWP